MIMTPVRFSLVSDYRKLYLGRLRCIVVTAVCKQTIQLLMHCCSIVVTAVCKQTIQLLMHCCSMWIISIPS